MPRDDDDAARRSSSVIGTSLQALYKPRALLVSLASPVRHLVSKKKKRFIKDGFDLDLSYITPRLIAMGYPTTAMEAVYRNPAGQVRAFFGRYHPAHAKVYNLCIERSYSAALLGLPDEQLEASITGFDHNPLPLFCVPRFCRSVDAWLSANPEHVAAVHCKAGKGRTGMLICCYLVWSGECANADEALALFGKMRTSNGKGVTIASQQRYVRYTEQMASAAVLTQMEQPPLRRIESVQLLCAPELAASPTAYFTIDLVHRQAPASAPANDTTPKWRSWRVYDHRKHSGYEPASSSGVSPAVEVGDGVGASTAAAEEHGSSIVKGIVRVSSAALSFGRSSSASYAAAGAPTGEGMAPPPGKQPVVAGDVKLVLHSGGKKIAACWFHTAFVEGDTLQIPKLQLDKARKNKQLDKDFAVHVRFSPVLNAGDAERERATLHVRAQNSEAAVVHGDDDDSEDDEDEAPAAGGMQMRREVSSVI